MDCICNRVHILHNHYNQSSFISFLFLSTYTTLANSKSPKIKCLGRLSTTFIVDIRRARVVLGKVDDEDSLPANDIEPRRSPN